VALGWGIPEGRTAWTVTLPKGGAGLSAGEAILWNAWSVASCQVSWHEFLLCSIVRDFIAQHERTLPCFGRQLHADEGSDAF